MHLIVLFVCSDDFVDAELVWSSDFNKTLQERQAKRLHASEDGGGVTADSVSALYLNYT